MSAPILRPTMEEPGEQCSVVIVTEQASECVWGMGWWLLYPTPPPVSRVTVLQQFRQRRLCTVQCARSTGSSMFPTK